MVANPVRRDSWSADAVAGGQWDVRRVEAYLAGRVVADWDGSERFSSTAPVRNRVSAA